MTTTDTVGSDRRQLGVHVDVGRSRDVGVLELPTTGRRTHPVAHVQEHGSGRSRAGQQAPQLVDLDQR